MTVAAADKLRAGDLLERLRRHYIRRSDFPGGIFVPEVGLNDPQQRRCDAVHIGFTSTSGKLLAGHEIKISRSDFLHELDDPHKATLWADNCHTFWLVTPRGLVEPHELPPDWGLMTPGSGKNTRMIVVKPAVLHLDRQPNWLVTRSIMARVDTLTTGELGKAKRAAAEAERESARLTALLEADERPVAEPTHDDAETRLARALLDAFKAGAQRKQDETGTGRLWPQSSMSDIVTAALDLAQARRDVGSFETQIVRYGYTFEQIARDAAAAHERISKRAGS